MLYERHLAGFGERLICRVLASPKLSVRTKTIKTIDRETPKPNWLLHWAVCFTRWERGNLDINTDSPIAEEYLPTSLWNSSDLKKKKQTPTPHSSYKLNHSTWGRRSKPREAQVFSDSFRTYISLSIRTKPSGKGAHPGLQASVCRQLLLPKEKHLAMCSH